MTVTGCSKGGELARRLGGLCAKKVNYLIIHIYLYRLTNQRIRKAPRSREIDAGMLRRQSLVRQSKLRFTPPFFFFYSIHSPSNQCIYPTLFLTIFFFLFQTCLYLHFSRGLIAAMSPPSLYKMASRACIKNIKCMSIIMINPLLC